MRIHLEGMGLQGSMIATLLARNGLDFTWNDTKESICAWPASTGAIYPSGSTKFGPDEKCRTVWAHWHQNKLFDNWTERATWCFSSVKPPHESKHRFHRIIDGRFGVLSAPSYHLNAQEMVAAARKRFANREDEQPPNNCTKIVTHGWTERRAYCYWGWTRLVQLACTQPFMDHGRPAFYFRPNRFVMVYAYPVPGTAYHYAGSSLLKQALGKEKSLSVEPKYELWKKRFCEMSAGNVMIVQEGKMLEGWRPVCADSDWVRVVKEGPRKHITLRPLWNSGIRHFPAQWTQLIDALGIPNTPPEERVQP